MIARILAVAAASLIGCAFASPTLAQGSDGERVNQVIVYGRDPCPKSTSRDEITVCARKDESERYRIPELLRGLDQPVDRAWTDRVLAYETVGNFGTQSCSPVGAGGFTGCTQQLVHNAYAEKKDGATNTFSQLIADERAKRLSTIDQDAKDTQARVEAEERAYDARKQSVADGDAGGTSAQPVASTPQPGTSGGN